MPKWLVEIEGSLSVGAAVVRGTAVVRAENWARARQVFACRYLAPDADPFDRRIRCTRVGAA